MTAAPSRRGPGAFARDEAAVSNVIAFAIAGAIFLSAAGLLMVLARTSIPPEQASDADPTGRIQAESALALLLTEGSSSLGGAGWDAGGPSPQRWTPGSPPGVPGLLEPDTRHLDARKVANMVGRPTSPDHRLDPVDLRLGLSLEPFTRVHLRVTPLLPPLEDGPPDLDLSVNYVAGPDPTLAARERDLIERLVEDPGDVDGVTAGALDLDVDVPSATCGAGTPDILVYGTDHADAAPGPDAAEIDVAVRVCGVTLVLLGSATPCSGCLATLVAATPPASTCAPLVVDDPTHPLVTVPNQVSAAGYATHGAMPSLGAAAGAFDAAAGSLPEPTLAASRCGSFGLGQAVVARLSPTALYGVGTATAAEGARLLHNVLVRHWQAMSFDYGDTLSDGPQVAPATAVVPGPVAWDGSRVPVRVALWVART